MNHLSDDQLYCLAAETEEMQSYQEEELLCMEHLKTCQECYEKYCAMSALLEITGESGSMVLSAILGQSKDKEAAVSLTKEVLAVVRVVRDRLQNTAHAIMEQIEQAGSTFQFAPSLAMAARGNGEVKSSIWKMEDLENEKTFIVFDAEKNELMVQLNLKNDEAENILVYLSFENAETREVILTRRGNIVKGILSNIPETSFQIHIESR